MSSDTAYQALLEKLEPLTRIEKYVAEINRNCAAYAQAETRRIERNATTEIAHV